MSDKSKKTKTLHIILGIMLAFGALNAFGGGWYGMSGSYFIPSLILFIVVGGSFLTASILK